MKHIAFAVVAAAALAVIGPRISPGQPAATPGCSRAPRIIRPIRLSRAAPRHRMRARSHEFQIRARQEMINAALPNCALAQAHLTHPASS